MIGPKFVRGLINPLTGRLTLERADGSVTEECADLFMVAGTYSDNGDSTFDVTFPGS